MQRHWLGALIEPTEGPLQLRSLQLKLCSLHGKSAPGVY